MAKLHIAPTDPIEISPTGGRNRAVPKPSKPPPEYTPPILPINTNIPSPNVTRRATASIQNREIMLSSPEGVRAYACGEQWLSGKLQYVFHNAAANQLWFVTELCAGECDALLDVTSSDGKPLNPLYFSQWWYPGTAAGAVDSHLAAVDPTWNEALPGTCYDVVCLYGFSTYWQAQLPNLVRHMRTRKVINCDTGVAAYSTNVWDQWYDFILWNEGKALPLARVDTTAFQAAKAADIAAGRNNAVHMLLMDAVTPEDAIESFRLLADAFWFWDDVNSRYTIVPDRAGAATAATYGDHQALRAFEREGERADPFDRTNRVLIWITDINNGRQLVQLPPIETAAVTAGTVDPVEEEHRLPWIYDASIGTRHGVYILNSHQYDLRIDDEWNSLTEGTKLGDVVTLDIPERGRTFKGRLVKRVKRTTGTFGVSLLEHNEAKFAATVVSLPAKTASTFPDPSAAPDDVNVATVSFLELLYTERVANAATYAEITLTNPSSEFLDHVDVYVSVNGGTFRYDGPAAGGAGQTVKYLFNNITDIGVPYTFKFISTSKFDRTSAGVTKTVTFAGKTTPPADVLGLFGGFNGYEAYLWWQPSSDPDVRTYEIRKGTTGDTWGTAKYAGQTNVTHWDDPAPLGQTARYLVKAIDYTAANYSTNAATFDVTVNPVEYAPGQADITLHPDSVAYGNVVAVPIGGFSGGFDYAVTQNGNLFFTKQIESITANGNIVYAEKALLYRTDVGPAAAEAERAAAGYTVAQWCTLIDDPRRNGAPLWAPLPANCSGEMYGAVTGEILRSTERHVRFKGVIHAGLDTPANVPVTQPFLRESDGTKTYGSMITTSPQYDVGRKWGIRISTNSRYYQEFVHSAGSGALLDSSYVVLPRTITQNGATTGASGTVDVVVPYSYAASLSGMQLIWMTITATPTTSSGVSLVVTGVAGDGTATLTITFKAVDSSGSAVASQPFRYEVIDNGATRFSGSWP
jgi:hypothetical protein